MNHLSLNVDETLAQFSSLGEDARSLHDDFAAESIDFSDDVFGLVHVDAARRLREALTRLHHRNMSFAQGLSDVCASGVDQVSAFNSTEEHNASGIGAINSEIVGGQ